MSTQVESTDEAIWQAWLARNRARDALRNVRRMKVVKWVSMGALPAAVLWFYLAP